MNCSGCYRPNIEGYCLDCRKELFGGLRIGNKLSFDMPKAGNLPEYQAKTARLSISGVQLKYSLRLENGQLALVEKGGQYILKPIPPSKLIIAPEEAPENEHLTMQMASKVFGIRTASNALIYFNDGAPAYITKRFDVMPDGGKYQQEDMAQISGRSKQTHGEHFKYDGSYEDIGLLIKKHVAAYLPAQEILFKTVLFNYLFSNGDAHLKNFSLIRTDEGDYIMSRAYDLMSTVLHTPNESDVALDLYAGDVHSAHYSKYGSYGRSSFLELAKRLELMPKRAERMMDAMLSKQERIKQMVDESLLGEKMKAIYFSNYVEKAKRLQ